jgi:hypothetical protein
METENYSPQVFVTSDDKYRAPNEEIFLLRKEIQVAREADRKGSAPVSSR